MLEAEWREFDFDYRQWTIPRQRAKNDRAHVVALSEAVVAILSALPRIGQPARFLFTTTGATPFSGISKATERLSKLAAAHMPAGQEIEPWRSMIFVAPSPAAARGSASASTWSRKSSTTPLVPSEALWVFISGMTSRTNVRLLSLSGPILSRSYANLRLRSQTDERSQSVRHL